MVDWDWIDKNTIVKLASNVNKVDINSRILEKATFNEWKYCIIFEKG